MKRHENLYSAIIAFVVSVLFIASGLIVHFVVLKPLVDDTNTLFENFVFRFAPIVLYVASAFFLIAGTYALFNDIMIEKGDVIIADVTGVKEYFYGKGSENIHYNVFAKWKNPADGKVYKYKMKNIPYNPEKKLSDKKVCVKINKKDPRQYYIMLD